MGHFAGRHQVIAIDLAGHGESGAGRHAWTMAAFGDDVVAVVEQLELEDIVLIGHSMGGDVIAEVAARLPHRVAGLVWVDVYSTLGEPRSSTELGAFVVPFREDFVTATRDFVRRMFVPSSPSDLVEWVVADMSAAPPEIALDGDGTRHRQRLCSSGSPERADRAVVAINADYRPNDIEALRRVGVETALMSGVGHFLMMEDPATFNRLLAETVEELQRIDVAAVTSRRGNARTRLPSALDRASI